MRLAPIFADNMVLQRDKECFIFGESESPEKITVKIDDIETTQSVQKGWWSFKLPVHPAGGPYEMTFTSEGGKKIVITNVMYGEVFLNNGQSNIELELKDSENGTERVESDNYPDIRYFNVYKTGSVYEAAKNTDSLVWKQATDKSFGDISAVGYYYALRLHKELGVAVGMIDCYVGGSSITCWIDKDRLLTNDFGRELYEKYYDDINRLPADIVETYEKKVSEYNKKTEEAQRRIKDISPQELVDAIGKYPWPPPPSVDSMFRPCGIERSMLKTVYPYTIRAVVYYQGEEDAVKNFQDARETGKNEMYYSLLGTLLQQYRDEFKDEKLPLILLQITMYIEDKEDMCDWAYLREAQDRFASEHEGVYLTALTDMGEYYNVHPLDKKTPGERTAGTILENLFDVRCGLEMSFRDIKRENGRIIIEFDNDYGKIITKDNALMDIRGEVPENSDADGHIYGFQVCGEDGVWYVPEAVIEDATIVINEKEKITEIRYGFFNYGKVNLYNAKGLPLKQFRCRGL